MRIFTLGIVVVSVMALVFSACSGSAEAEQHYNAGLALQEQGNPEEAIQQYSEAIRRDPEYASAYYQRGSAYSDLLRHDQAVLDYDEAIRLDPQLVDAYFNRGRAYHGLGMYEQSIQGYDEALRLDAQDAFTYHNRGLAYFSLGQYQRSLEDFDEAIRLDPQLADARRVMVFTLLNMDSEAEGAVDKAVEVGVDRAQLEKYIKSLKMVR